MPYIDPTKRPVLDSALVGLTPKDEGELNYTITKLVKQFINRNGVSYKTFNTVVGVLDCAKLELYRVDVSFYEEKKRMENGEVI